MKKFLLVFGLIFFVFISSYRIFSFAQDLDTMYVTEEDPIEIVTQVMETEGNKNLVPKGSSLGVNDVDEVVFTYKVFVETGKTLVIDTQNLTVNGIELDSEIVDLFHFDFEQTVIKKDLLTTDLFGSNKEGAYRSVSLVLSMDEPNYEQYQIIAGGVMNFKVIFTAVDEIIQ